ncbi:MAG: anthranilate synthase component I [Pelagibacterales bacterium]|nr:anthranilate synthase component I [Pelagibacterales bacterium]
MYNFTKAEFCDLLSKSNSAVLYKKIPTDTITPVLASLKISKKYPDYNFLFESAEKGNNKGRFSVIGLMPDLVWKCSSEESFLNDNFANDKNSFVKEQGNPIQNLRQLINKSQIEWSSLSYANGELPGICGGIFGYMSYDMVRLMEKIKDNNLPDDLKIPDSIFMRPQILIIFDNLFDCALICAPIFSSHINKNSAEIFDLAIDRIKLIEEILSESYEKTAASFDPKFDFSSNYTESEYVLAVEKAKKYIVDGDIFQVLPSQRFVSNFDSKISEFSFYRALRAINPSPFLFYLKLPDFTLIGSSPEIMVSAKSKKITIRPLAGTRKRGKTIEEDKKIAEGLLSDEKEVAEHLMLIDLGRHDVGRVCVDGSVKVTEKMVIENYSHVMHISSNVEGILREDLDALDALISGFPAGTVSGAPKIRAMEIIEEIEKTRRGFYAGCVGYFSANGDMETCITLRSSLIKDGKIYLQAGAGVVFDSDAKSEYQECINKSQALVKACEAIKDFL